MSRSCSVEQKASVNKPEQAHTPEQALPGQAHTAEQALPE
jgi:hypothetical protein